MPRIVYITNAMASTLNSSFELSRRLSQAGHEVIYLSHVDIAAQVQPYGYRAIHLEKDRELLREFRTALNSKPDQPFRFFRRLALGRRFFQQSVAQSEIEDTVKSLAPDMLIIDIECHFAILACLNLRIPMALAIVWHSIFLNWDLPPLHSRTIPNSTLVSRIKCRWSWIWLLIQRRFSHWLAPLSPHLLKRRLKPVLYDSNQRFELLAVARARQIDFAAATDPFHWLRPHLYRGMDVLCFNALEFEFPHKPPPELKFAGPMVFENRNELGNDRAKSETWEKFRQDSKDESRKLVYCSLGTYWSTNLEFLQKLVSVFERKSQWSLVIGLGGKTSIERMGKLPGNVLAMEFAPQIEILKSADAAITHGGITSINECLFFNVPVLCCSTGFVDQNGCCARVEYHEVGLQMDINLATPNNLEKSLDRLLNDSKIRNQVRKMSEVYKKYRDEFVAESYFASLMNRQ